MAAKANWLPVGLLPWRLGNAAEMACGLEGQFLLDAAPP